MSLGKNTTKKTSLKITCLKCGKPQASNTQNYYANTNPLLSSDKLEICKDCISLYIGDKGSISYLDRIKLVLALLDKPFLQDLWEQRDCDWSKYIPQLSTLSQYKGLTFKDSNFENKVKVNKLNETNSYSSQSTVYTEEEIQELSSFWGKGLEVEDLEYLQNEYEKFINSYECDSYAMELLFQEASQCRLTIKKLRSEGKSVDKELKTLQDLLGSANVKPVQETGANAAEQATFGTLIKKYENDRPIPEPDPAWKDVDGIKKYIQVWFLGHLCKMIGIQNEYSAMYEEELAKHSVESPVYEDDQEIGDIK